MDDNKRLKISDLAYGYVKDNPQFQPGFLNKLEKCAFPIVEIEDLKDKLLKIDNGRFKKIIGTLVIKPVCGKCFFFMPTIKDCKQAYRCHCAGSCIAATLSFNLLSYLWWQLDIITEEEHLKNLRWCDNKSLQVSEAALRG